MDQSLDDFIKHNRGKMPKRGRGAGRQQISRLAVKNVPQRGGMVSKRGRGGPFPSAGRVTDARFKIIAKKRLTIVDARDQLAQLSMQMDARDKLNNLRVQRRGVGKPRAAKQVDARAKLNQNKVWRGARQQVAPGTVRWPQAGQQAPRTTRQPPRLNRGGGFVGAKVANFDVDLLYEDDEDLLDPEAAYGHAGMFQRTVHNPVAPRGPLMPRGPAIAARAVPKFPALRVKVPLAELDYEDSYYEDEEEEMEVERHLPLRPAPPPMSRAPPARAPMSRAPPARPQSSRPPPQPSRPVRPTTTKSHYPALRQDWTDLQKTSIVVRNEHEGPDGHISQQLRSRLDVSGRFTQPPAPVGVKVHVSNLQASVTEEDIKELFGDLGPLLQWRLIRPGTAEVVYKQRAHAVSAVDVYHKRQLDGQPMNVVLASPGAAPASKFSSGQSKLSHGKGIQPDLGIIHKALFKN